MFLNTGTAYTFFTEENAANARKLIKVLEDANQPVNPELQEMSQTIGCKLYSSKVSMHKTPINL